LVWNYGNFIDTVLVSNPGEPEAIDQTVGLLQLPASAYGITKCQEYRDTLYVFRAIQTFAYTDNSGDPTGWPSVIIDEGIGCGKHGLAIIGDTNLGIGIEAIIVIGDAGIFLFNGIYQVPELSFKIQDFWSSLVYGNKIVHLETYVDLRNRLLYVLLPDQQQIWVGDFKNGLNFKAIKWWPWSFPVNPTCMTLFLSSNELVFAA